MTWVWKNLDGEGKNQSKITVWVVLPWGAPSTRLRHYFSPMSKNALETSLAFLSSLGEFSRLWLPNGVRRFLKPDILCLRVFQILSEYIEFRQFHTALNLIPVYLVQTAKVPAIQPEFPNGNGIARFSTHVSYWI